MPTTPLKLFNPTSEQAADVLASLLTPSRDTWVAVTLGDIERILDRPDLNRHEMACELLELIEKNMTVKIAEER